MQNSTERKSILSQTNLQLQAMSKQTVSEINSLLQAKSEQAMSEYEQRVVEMNNEYEHHLTKMGVDHEQSLSKMQDRYKSDAADIAESYKSDIDEFGSNCLESHTTKINGLTEEPIAEFYTHVENAIDEAAATMQNMCGEVVESALNDLIEKEKDLAKLLQNLIDHCLSLSLEESAAGPLPPNFKALIPATPQTQLLPTPITGTEVQLEYGCCVKKLNVLLWK